MSIKFEGGMALEKALTNAFKEWATTDINDKHWRKQFIERQWQYQRNGQSLFTERQNGSVAGNPRDIYDLGELYRSGVRSFDLQDATAGASAEWHWNATNDNGGEYAWFVHEGTGKMPARPFTDDISLPSSFFDREPGQDLLIRVNQELRKLER